MKLSPTATFITGGVVALVLGTGTAYAATGGTFILGKSNVAGATTVLTNVNGTALTLGSKSGTPPLKLSNSTKTVNMNGDLLDGLDSTRFARADIGSTGSYFADGYGIDYDEPTDGVTDATGAYVECPTGTKMTGGGSYDVTGDGHVTLSIPLDNGWYVESSSTTAAPDELTPDVSAFVVCYNPRGALPDFRVKTTAKKVVTMRESLKH